MEGKNTKDAKEEPTAGTEKHVVGKTLSDTCEKGTKFSHKVGALARGNDLRTADCTVEQAKRIAERIEGCVGFTFYGSEDDLFNEGKKRIFFKSSSVGNDDKHWQTCFVRRGSNSSTCGADAGEAKATVAEGAPKRGAEKAPLVDKPLICEFASASLVVDLATGDVTEDYLGEEAAFDDNINAGLLLLPIGCYPCVDERAVQIAAGVVKNMLKDAPLDVRQRLVDHRACVGIIGKEQVTSDIPAHRFLRGVVCRGGRNYDKETRGVGGVPRCPCTSVGEENVLMENDRHFPSESILVHEFGHAVMNMGLSEEDVASVSTFYANATEERNKGEKGWLGTAGSNYMLSNPQEFWAEATQAWFSATARSDVNCNLKCRGDVRGRCEEGFVQLLEITYGDGEWRYVHDCPRPWGESRL